MCVWKLALVFLCIKMQKIQNLHRQVQYKQQRQSEWVGWMKQRKRGKSDSCCCTSCILFRTQDITSVFHVSILISAFFLTIMFNFIQFSHALCVYLAHSLTHGENKSSVASFFLFTPFRSFVCFTLQLLLFYMWEYECVAHSFCLFFRCSIAYGKYLIPLFLFSWVIFFFSYAFAVAFLFYGCWSLNQMQANFVVEKCMWKSPTGKIHKRTWMASVCHRHTNFVGTIFRIFNIFPMHFRFYTHIRVGIHYIKRHAIAICSL